MQRKGLSVLWIPYPTYGNTCKTDNGYKTYNFDKIHDKIFTFFDVHDGIGLYPGRCHLDINGEDVTECVGDISNVRNEILPGCYNVFYTLILSGDHTLNLDLLIVDQIRERTGLPLIE